MDAESLQAMSLPLYIAQRFAHQLQAAEDAIIEVSDFLDEHGIQHRATLTSSAIRSGNSRLKSIT
jgi:hypothetical protein